MTYRRRLAAAVALMMGAVVAAPSAVHADVFHFHGVVVDAFGGGPVAGLDVIATEPGAAGPAWSVTTAPDGTWSFDADAEEYNLYIDGGSDHQSGYRGCFGYLVPDAGSACTVGPGWEIETLVMASFVSGRILDRATAEPVAGAIVMAFREDGITLISSAPTAADGTYRVDGIDHEELGLHVDGSSVGYDSGWFACATGVVVPTFGEACTHAPGPDGDRYLDAITADDPPRFRLRSRASEAITLIVRDPGTDREVLGYELTCHSRRTGDVTTATYDTDGETRYGFDRGLNRCTLEVVTVLGPGPESRARVVRVR